MTTLTSTWKSSPRTWGRRPFCTAARCCFTRAHTHIHTVQATRVPQAGMPTMQRHPGSKVILRELCSRVIKSRVWLS